MRFHPPRRRASRVFHPLPIAGLLVLVGSIAAAQVEVPLALDHVILISIDGLRADAVDVIPEERVPTLLRLLTASSTLNARTIESWTRTLPNHVSMVTSRPEAGPFGHRWEFNDARTPDVTLHTNHGSYLASVFDVAHDNGLFTAVYAGKERFDLFSRSYGDQTGADDVTGADDGRDKIDSSTTVDNLDADDLVDGVLDEIDTVAAGRSLFFLHFHDPDSAGHVHEWDLSPDSEYVAAVSKVDAAVGRILDAITTDPRLLGRSAVILTADHGGGAPPDGHGPTEEPLNYTIPLFVWLCDGQPTLDLYAINADTRTDPGTAQVVDPPTPDQPIRNADAGNLALSLLGLPAIPGSAVNAGQDLRAVISEPTCLAEPDCTPATEVSDCDDGNGCTVDECDGGICVRSEACDQTCQRCLADSCEPRCGFPVSEGTRPLITDALYALRASVGSETCAGCVCDVDGNGGVTVRDALALMSSAVGLDVELGCAVS